MAEFDSPQLGEPFNATQHDIDIAADTKIEAGHMVAYNAIGNAIPAADTVGLTVIGKAPVTVDNTGGAIGDEVMPSPLAGINGYTNSGDISADDRGTICYVEDSTTVVLADPGNAIKAGTIVDVDPVNNLVYVDQSASGLK